MFERHREHRDRPEVITAFNNALNVSTHFLHKLRNATPDEKYLDDDDLDGLQTILEENQVIPSNHSSFFYPEITPYIYSFDYFSRGWKRKWCNKKIRLCMSLQSSH